ncbi:glycosyltransferase family 39 protein [Alicyclobacillus cycloheptanicus]|uniref:Dolichyl-phosphate-mannose-protein mannosyltransferase n=1 Tax=Alicyclobacillus cycloheptanicus TaxID=1457 RepID=A0ABT9XF32_9BACL|nr:hypothetical protein [Alicyclobacillus cycloheptanicus]MDQ0188907.1 hypothetical protein [Alicyclobacillus cycloheptanicus]WDM01741.1 glycosyltransferase family 39 protein [Alicyclobacillus cycloheptanicus]
MTDLAKQHTWSRVIVFATVFLVECSLGWYLNVVRYDVQNDALSRVANAFYVLYSRDPHLAAIGFVWNPLPSLLELPVILFWHVYPPLVTCALAGTLLTALAAAAQTLLIVRQFQHSGLKTWHGIAVSLCLCANPFMLLYGANGMSEMIFSFFLVWCTCSFADWLRTYRARDLVRAGLALALAFLTRYEAVAFGAAMTVGVCLAAWQYGEKQFLKNPQLLGDRRFKLRNLRDERFWYTESTVLVFLLPSLYMGILWILLNWIIMGDPLYFFHSAYSNLSQSSVLQSTSSFEAMMGNPIAVARFIAERIGFFSLPYFGILVYRARRGQLFQWTTLVLTLLVASIPALQYSLLLKGASYGWLRFFFYPLPLSIAWLPYELSMPPRMGQHVRKKRRSGTESTRKWGVVTAFVCTLVVSGVAVSFAMNNSTLAPEEYDTIHQKYNITRLETTRAIAQYLNEYEPNATILMDSFSSFNVIVNVRHPKHLVITSDRDFVAALHHPVSHHVQYILVPQPDATYRFDAVNQAYPDLYAHGSRWAKLVKQFPGWRLYRVTG